MGINYGHCPRCTPREVLDLDNELNLEVERAGERYDQSREKDRTEYIRQQTAALRAKYLEAYERGKK